LALGTAPVEASLGNEMEGEESWEAFKQANAASTLDTSADFCPVLPRRQSGERAEEETDPFAGLLEDGREGRGAGGGGRPGCGWGGGRHRSWRRLGKTMTLRSPSSERRGQPGGHSPLLPAPPPHQGVPLKASGGTSACQTSRRTPPPPLTCLPFAPCRAPLKPPGCSPILGMKILAPGRSPPTHPRPSLLSSHQSTFSLVLPPPSSCAPRRPPRVLRMPGRRLSAPGRRRRPRIPGLRKKKNSWSRFEPCGSWRQWTKRSN
jgi:hypothetical protein